MNDLVDVENDKSRGLKTVTVLYGEKGSANWVLAFTILHAMAALPFIAGMVGFSSVAAAGLVAELVLLMGANSLIRWRTTSTTALIALPVFHLAISLWAISVIVQYGV